MPLKKRRTKSDISLDEAYLQGKVLELFRQIIGSTTLADIHLPEDFDPSTRQSFSRFCHQTYHNEFFDVIIKALYYPVILYAAQNAPDYPAVTFSRATANGVKLTEELFQHWANIYDTEYAGKEEDFDPNKPFEPTIK